MGDIKKQVIYGTLLGNAYIPNPKRGNCYLVIPERRNLIWLRYKALRIEGATDVKTEEKRWIWKSKSDKYWNHIREEFYNEKGKSIKMDMLDILTGDALATWFLDKGYFISKKRIALRTTVFGLQGNKIIQQYFNEVDMPCEIRRERDTGKIVFSEVGTQELKKVIQQFMPPNLLYRLKN